MRIAGFNDRGEVRIVDDHGRLVAYGELRLEDAHLTGVDTGDRFGLEVLVTWTFADRPEAADAAGLDDEPDDAALPQPEDVDFDGLDWNQLLG
jgi:hypothetical protein